MPSVGRRRCALSPTFHFAYGFQDVIRVRRTAFPFVDVAWDESRSACSRGKGLSARARCAMSGGEPIEAQREHSSELECQAGQQGRLERGIYETS